MATRKQNSRGDFTASHIFYKDGAQVAVPSHVEVQYYTDEMCGKFICERNGDKRHYCSISDDGMTLFTHLALSEKFIGNGQLRYVLIEYVADGSFPAGERACPVPGRLNVQLWTGATDDEIEVLETSTLQSVVNDIQGMQSQIAQLTIANDEVLEVANTVSKIVAEFHDELSNKADIDGKYPQMTVGKSENLVGRSEATEEYINFRQSAGKVSIEDGTARIAALKGNSVLWKNLMTTSINSKGYDVSKNNDGSYMVYRNDESGGWISHLWSEATIVGHRYLFWAAYQTTDISSSSDYVLFKIYDSGATGSPLNVKVTEDTIGTLSCVFESETQPTDPTSRIKFSPMPCGAATCIIDEYFSIDLTRAFGSEVAKTINSIEDFNKIMPIGIDKFARNAGEIVSMTADSLVSVSENAFDKRVGYAKVLPKTYNFEGTYTSLEFATTLDGIREDITLNGNNQYTFEQEGYVFAKGENICINIKHSYDKAFMHDYQESVVNLDFIKSIKDNEDNLLFPFGLCSVNNIYDEIRYNKTTQKWEAVKRIEAMDLGQVESWVNDWTAGNVDFRWYFDAGAKPVPWHDKLGNLLCSKYNSITAQDNSTRTEGVAISTKGNIILYDKAYNQGNGDAKNRLIESLQGVILLYELATPIIVELDDAINLDYTVWDFGTEEVKSTSPSTPLRADIIYQFNAVDRIRNNSDRIAELDEQIKENSNSITSKQDTLTLSVKDNGNIVIGNLTDEPQEFMPATPSGDPMHYAYVTAGAIWDSGSNSWTLNTVTGISTGDMRKIYNFGHFHIFDREGLRDISLRTVLHRKGGANANGEPNLTNFAFGATKLETVSFMGSTVIPSVMGASTPYEAYINIPINTQNMFNGCTALKAIYGRFGIGATGTFNANNFAGCAALERVAILGLAASISFQDSPNLSKESLLYMINKCKDNSGKDNPISLTITLHPDVYAKCNSSVDPLEGAPWEDDVVEAINDVFNSKNVDIEIKSA